MRRRRWRWLATVSLALALALAEAGCQEEPPPGGDPGEQCDGLDNDGDGAVDEGFDCVMDDVEDCAHDATGCDGERVCQFETNKPYYDTTPWVHQSVLMFSRDAGRTWPRHTVVTRDPRIFYWDQRPQVLPDGRILDLFWTYGNAAAAYLNIHARDVPRRRRPARAGAAGPLRRGSMGSVNPLSEPRACVHAPSVPAAGRRR